MPTNQNSVPMKRETEYLGYILTRDGIKPQSNKIEAIKFGNHKGAQSNPDAIVKLVSKDLSSTCRMSACRFFAQTATFCVVSATCRRHVSVMSQTQENVLSARVSKRHDI